MHRRRQPLGRRRDGTTNTRRSFLLVFLGGLWFLSGLGSASAQTNYPVEATIELRDSNGQLLDAFTSVCPADGVSVMATGWSANSNVHGTFHSDPVDVGFHPTDAQGVVRFTFRVADVQSGLHTLRLEGTGANGQPRAVEASMVCKCPQPPISGPVVTSGGGSGAGTSVLGRTTDRGAVNSNNGNLAFATTGANLRTLLWIGVDLLIVGYVIRVAQRKTRLA